MRALIASFLIFLATRPEPPAFVVIANPETPNVDRRFVRDAFLKKVSRWPDDKPLRPVDQKGDSEVRIAFSFDVLGRSVGTVRTYWHQQIFSGRDTPPPELDSDAEVLHYVLGHPGAIGYISGKTSPDRAKVVQLE